MSEIWTYWCSRDSVDGVLAARCSLWCVKPRRVKINGRVTWTALPGFLGNHPIDHIAGWFRVYPETDLELIRAEQNVTARMMEEARKQGKR